MSVTERLGRLSWIRLHETPVAVWKVHGEVVGFLLHSADDHTSFTVVALGLSRRMGQRHEHLSRLSTPLANIVFYYRVLAWEPVLVSQAVIDALARVALLLRERLIVLQNTVDHSFVGV